MEYQDWYTPRDYYGSAQLYARDYLKSHPEADSQTAYLAAQEAAELYERSARLRMFKFKGIVHWKIVNELYKRRKKEMMTKELKASIIRDYETGMTPKEIAERYGLHPHTTHSNLVNWAKAGLVTLRESTASLQNKPVHIPQKKSRPETTEVESSPCKTSKNDIAESISQDEENVKPIISFVDAASIFADCFNEWLGEEIELVECRASNRDNSATLILEDINGQSYALQFKKLED